MRKPTLTLVMRMLAAVASCESEPALWTIDLPRTGTFPIGQVACEPYELPRMTLTVIDPLGAPYIAEERIWSCGPLPDDSVQCDQTSANVASMLNIVPSHVMYRLDFDDGKACIYHFGDI